MAASLPGVEKAATAIFTLAIAFVVSAVIGFVASRLYKGDSRRARRAIGVSISSICLAVGALIALYRLRSG